MLTIKCPFHGNSKFQEVKKHKYGSPHYKALQVDDEQPMRKLIVSLLSRKGHQCITANNGIEALDKISENKFNAIITDFVMPEMDGIALTKELSKH